MHVAIQSAIGLDGFFEGTAQVLLEGVQCLRSAFLGPFFDVGDLGIVADGVVGLTGGAGEDFGVW